MSTDSLDRLFKLLRTNSKAASRAIALGRLEALLIIALVVATGFAVSLCDVGLFRADHPVVPTWIRSTSASEQPQHRYAAEFAGGLVERFPILKSNAVVLAILASKVFILGLLWIFVHRARVRAVYQATTAAALALRKQLHRQFYRLGESSLPSEGLGVMLNLFQREVNYVQKYLTRYLSTTPQYLVLAVGLLAFSLMISAPLTLYFLGLLYLARLVMAEFRHAANRHADQAAREAALQAALLQEDLTLIRTVRVYSIESLDRERFEQHLDHHHEAELDRVLAENQIPFGVLFVLLLAATLVLMMTLGGVLISGQVSAASALIVLGLVIGVGWSWTQYQQHIQALSELDRAAKSIYGYLSRRPELQMVVGAQFLKPMERSIVFENVTVRSQSSGAPLLDRFRAEIPAGSRVVFMGLNEDSKYAVAGLIPRLLDPEEGGAILIDGVDLRDVTIESLRAQVGVVFQSDLAFSNTVAANIGLDIGNNTLAKIVEAAKIAHAHNFIRQLPQGYDTLIGPLGHPLRPDELYRIALARIYLHDPSILIIEEPSEPMDEDAKRMIDDSLARLSQGRTVIFLPHRLSTIRNANLVVVIHDGRVEAIGTPKDLQHSCKLYRHLQYVEFNHYATGDIEAGPVMSN